MNKYEAAPCAGDIRHIVQALASIVGSDWVLAGDEAVAPFECDALFHVQARPLAVVLPADETQVIAIVRFCASQRIPIVPRGAGTSLSGGATPVEGGVVISLNRLKSLEINAQSRLARSGPGVRNLKVSTQAEPFGLFFAPDPSSQSASTIGGNIAENAGGVHCVKYGLTVNNVVAARVVTGDGELLELGRGSLDRPGLDILSLINGSEGLLGLVTEAELKLLPLPQTTQVLLAFFPTIRATCVAVTDIIGDGIVPAGLEVMDSASICAADGYSPSLHLRTDAGGALLCELDGELTDIEETVERVMAIFAEHAAVEVRHAKDAVQRRALWSARKNILPTRCYEAPRTYTWLIAWCRAGL